VPVGRRSNKLPPAVASRFALTFLGNSSGFENEPPPEMNFERADILRPILDHLSANDQMLFYGLQQRILGQATGRGMPVSSAVAVSIFAAFQNELTERAEKLFSEMQRVLDREYFEDFDNLAEALKIEWNGRLESMASVASSEYTNSTVQIRLHIQGQLLPSSTALSEHVEKLKPKWFAEIELFCPNLHNSQAPRLFLKAGEVFAGNRAARAVFAAAKQSLDIIDNYLGPQVFDMMELSSASVRIRLISNSDKVQEATKRAYTLFNQQFKDRAEFRLCDPDPSKLHDRFIIVDGLRALHLGGSIKDLGKTDSLIDSAEPDPHKKQFEELWLKAQPVI
jgi:hypothetical protein